MFVDLGVHASSLMPLIALPLTVLSRFVQVTVLLVAMEMMSSNNFNGRTGTPLCKPTVSASPFSPLSHICNYHSSLGHSSGLKNYFTSSDPHHDISIICLDAIVRSMLPWS